MVYNGYIQQRRITVRSCKTNLIVANAAGVNSKKDEILLLDVSTHGGMFIKSGERYILDLGPILEVGVALKVQESLRFPGQLHVKFQRVESC